MAIQISPNGRLMTIQTNDSSYQMLADKNGVLLHLYYGSSIGAEDLSDLIVSTSRMSENRTPLAHWQYASTHPAQYSGVEPARSAVTHRTPAKR